MTTKERTLSHTDALNIATIAVRFGREYAKLKPFSAPYYLPEMNQVLQDMLPYKEVFDTLLTELSENDPNFAKYRFMIPNTD